MRNLAAAPTAEKHLSTTRHQSRFPRGALSVRGKRKPDGRLRSPARNVIVSAVAVCLSVTTAPPVAALTNGPASADVLPRTADRAVPKTVTAADRKALKACRDGKCTVTVKAGDVLRFNKKLRTPPITVRSTGAAFRVTTRVGHSASVTGSGSVQIDNVRITILERKEDRTRVRVSRVR